MPRTALITANGDTSEILVKGPVFFRAAGTWGSGTFKVYLKSTDGSWKELTTSTAMTSDATGQNLFDLPPNRTVRIKATLSGATSPSLNWEFIGQILEA